MLLAGFAARILGSARKSVTGLCDLGTGTGIIPLILSHKVPVPRLAGVEIQDRSVELARQNVEMNGLTGRFSVIQGDISSLDRESSLLAELGGAGSWDAVTSNPPYTANTGGLHAENRARAVARQEVLADLDDFLRSAELLLKDRGDFFLVHRPSRMADIIAGAREHHLEPKELRLVSPREGEGPNIMLLHCVRGGGPELKVDPPLYVRKPDGNYSDEVLRIYEKM